MESERARRVQPQEEADACGLQAAKEEVTSLPKVVREQRPLVVLNMQEDKD